MVMPVKYHKVYQILTGSINNALYLRYLNVVKKFRNRVIVQMCVTEAKRHLNPSQTT